MPIVYHQLLLIEKLLSDRLLVSFNQAIEIDPNFATAYYYRGLVYYKQGDYDKAIVSFDRAIFLDPILIEAYISQGLAYSSKGNFSFAIIKFNEVISLDPNFVPAYIERGRAYHSRGEYDRALVDYNTVIKLDPNLATGYYERGNTYQSMGNYDSAVDDYSTAIKLDPNLAITYYKRGEAYSSKGYDREAWFDQWKAFSLDPHLAISYYINLGNTYFAEQDYSSAISCFDKLAEYTPQVVSDELASKISSAYSKRELAYCHLYTYDLDVQKLLFPDFDNGERLVLENDWLNNLQLAIGQDFDFYIANLEEYSRECWNEVIQRRKYQVSSGGRVEVLASKELEYLINLTSVKFIQEGVNPPGVFIKLRFGDGLAIGIVKINQDGSTEGFHKRSGNKLFQAIIDTVALSYFRDLVTPGKSYLYESGTRPRKSTSSFPRPPKPRTIPRPQNKSTYRELPHISIRTWQETHVDGYLRKLPIGQMASPEKYQESLKFLGIPLPEGYTFVNSYERGFISSDFWQTFLCLPPERASNELNELIWGR